jgi:sterol desaturase/sphingolipid hydroxylase (fatty acid hydroxylase superfamily)
VPDDLTILAVPVFLATMAAECLLLRRRSTVGPDVQVPADVSNVQRPIGYSAKDTAASLAMGLGMLVVGGVAHRVLAPATRWLYDRRVVSLGGVPDPATGRVSWPRELAAILAWDFLYYWQHRLGHERRVLWAAHVNHHSSRRYNLSTALRQSWTGEVGHWVYAPLFVLGFSPAQVARAGQLNLLYQFWVHTELVDRLPGWAERVLNTASHHRVHHGSVAPYLDRNYGGILIVWDRLFGTFEPESVRVRYGLTTDIETVNPVRIAFHEWAALLRDLRRARSWREAIRYAVRPPGWSPEPAPAGVGPAGGQAAAVRQ